MVLHEAGQLGQTDEAGLILNSILAGVFGAVAFGMSLFPTQDADAQRHANYNKAEEDSLVLPAQDPAGADLRRRRANYHQFAKNYSNWNKKKWMSLLAIVTHLFVAVAFSARYFQIGEFEKTCNDTFTNYAFFALLAFAAGVNGYLMSIFFKVRTGGGKAFVALSWTCVFVLLSIGTLACRGVVRNWAFSLSIIGQGVSVFAILYGSELPHILTNISNYVVLAFLTIGLVIFDTFWYIGSYNEPSSAAILNSDFGTQIAMLIGGCLPFFTLAPFFGMLMYGMDYFDLWAIFTTEEESLDMLTEDRPHHKSSFRGQSRSVRSELLADNDTY